MSTLSTVFAGEHLGDLLTSVLIIVLVALLGRIMLFFVDRLLTKIAGRTRTELDDVIIGAVRTPVFVLIILAGIQIGLSRLDFLPLVWMSFLKGLLYAAFVLAGYVLLYRLIRDVLRWYARTVAVRTETRLDDEVVPFFRRLLLVVLTAVVFIMLLQRFGFDVTGFVATLGVGSLAIALAAQAALTDAVAGLVLLFDHPYRVGDRILLPSKIGGHYGSWGDVERITLRSTRVRSTDGVILTIPNSWMVKNTVINFSHESDPTLRVRVRVGVAPTWSNVRRAMEIMGRVISNHPVVQHTLAKANDEGIQTVRPPQVVVRDIQDWNVLLEVRFYVSSPREMRTTRSEVIQGILEAFEQEGVDVPYPTEVIYYQPAEYTSPDLSTARE